jgi:GNAT superfamily N-acetyltransferase
VTRLRAARRGDELAVAEVHVRSWVVALYVDPDRHRGGVGRLLMAEARHRLREAGFTEALLWVLDGNDRAACFYEREGWTPDGATRVEHPYGIVSNVSRLRRSLQT